MCPIETPEGPNIGLITSLSTYARINDLGLHRDAVPRGEERQGHRRDPLARRRATRRTSPSRRPTRSSTPTARSSTSSCCAARATTSRSLPPDRIDFMDVAPEQLVSIAAALIPFLEHDDANRALMGSNMQRQACRSSSPQAPLVGTGLEEKVARDSGAVIIARRSGDGHARHGRRDHRRRRRRRAPQAGRRPPLARLHQHDRYRVKKYWRTNQDTAINQRPLVQLGQQVEAGEVIADGAATESGELALGSNVIVAFMPWYGHNFEDAIVLSRAAGEGRRLLVDPHPGARAARPRHQARPGRDHAGNPERRRGERWSTSTSAASSASART